MSKLLTQVSRAAKRREDACADAFAAYLNSIRTAREAGHTLTEIGQAAGLTKQGVRYLLHGDPRKEPKT